jgi:hypothetical protein
MFLQSWHAGVDVLAGVMLAWVAPNGANVARASLTLHPAILANLCTLYRTAALQQNVLIMLATNQVAGASELAASPLLLALMHMSLLLAAVGAGSWEGLETCVEALTRSPSLSAQVQVLCCLFFVDLNTPRLFVKVTS